MRATGVETVVDSSSLSVVGLVEVLHHIPRIYGEYRKLLRAVDERRPVAAILTDSPDFHLRLAKQLHRRGIPVFYLVAPQAWAWRAGRAVTLSRNVKELHCIFPFEEEFFRQRGVEAHYIGHPLTRKVHVSSSREQFLSSHQLSASHPVVTLCPGSRRGEVGRHLDVLAATVARMSAEQPCQFVLATPAGSRQRFSDGFLDPFLRQTGVKWVEGETWDTMAHADVTLAASGTVTIEAALLGAPMVTYYKVTPVTWWLGQFLVRVPYYSMVNLVAGRRLVEEFIQDRMQPSLLADAALTLLNDEARRDAMREGLRQVRQTLWTDRDPFVVSAARIAASLC
jgi:lipid-A-disaccharide synthase